MKKRPFIAIITMVLMAAGCSTEKTPENINIAPVAHRINVTGNTNITFGYNSNLSSSLKIEADNTGWELTGIPTGWLSATPTAGKTTTDVRLTAQENKSVDESRVAIMRVQSTEKGYNYSKDISVSQSAAEVVIAPRETSFSSSAAASVKTLSVDANVDWVAECSEEWLTLTKVSNSQLNISLTENLAKTRKATITLKRSGTSAAISTVAVTQEEAGVTGSTETLTFDANGGTKNVPITADASWSAYTSDPSWLSVSPESGKNGSATITISATTNASTNTRSGFVYIKIGDETKLSIPVQQEGMSLSIEGTLQVMNGEGTNSYQLSVVSTSKWSVKEKNEWLNITPDNGESGTTNIVVSAEKNSSIHSRQGSFTISIPNTPVSVNINVEQAGITIGPNTLYFGWSENSQSLNLSAPNAWNAMTSTDWITLSQYSGTGVSDIAVSVAINDNEDERNGTINIVTEGETKDIAVHQDGQYLKINPFSYSLSPMGSSFSITVSTTVGSQYSVDYLDNAKDWIQVSNNEGNIFKLTLSANPSRVARRADFSIKPTMATTNQACSSGVKQRIKQDGRSLSTSVKEIEMFSKGGTSSIYTIQAHGEYDIKKKSDDSWYVLQHDESANTFSVIVSKNTTKKKREGLITLSLLNMPEGESYIVEIPIIQYPSGVSIDIEGFGDDKNWN